ncbi:MAG TPA: hypothetical protein VF604_19380 [Pyrinomonadaceae bacterium]
MKFLTVFFALIIFVFAAHSASAQASSPDDAPPAPDYYPEKWKEFTYETDGVKFRFPANPTLMTSTETVSDQKVTTRKYTRRSFIAMELWVVEYSPDSNLEEFKPIKETLQNLRGVALDSIKSSNPKVIKESEITVDGHAGKFMHVETDKGEVLRFKFFLVKNRMYYAFAAVKKGEKHGFNYENDFEKVAMGFLDSIKLTSAKK